MPPLVPAFENPHPTQYTGLLLGGFGSLTFPFWAIRTLATVHRADLTGSCGYGHLHPRASWLTLLVTSKHECACGALATWEDGEGGVYCGRCAEAEGALADARRLARGRA